MLTLEKNEKNIKTIKVISNPLTTNIPHHVETSQLICHVNQLTGFYRGTLFVIVNTKTRTCD